MKKVNIGFICTIGVLFFGLSCKKSPANITVGTYEGSFTRSALASETGRVHCVEVNSLTINFTAHLDGYKSISYVDVQVLGGGEPYTLYYTGIEGELNGTVDQHEMAWIAIDGVDTVSFNGHKD